MPGSGSLPKLIEKGPSGKVSKKTEETPYLPGRSARGFSWFLWLHRRSTECRMGGTSFEMIRWPLVRGWGR